MQDGRGVANPFLAIFWPFLAARIVCEASDGRDA